MIFYRKHSNQVTCNKKQAHKNYLEKFKHKKNNLIEQAQNKVDNLEAFRSLSILDNDTKTIIDLLILHYKNYQNTYVNTKLYNILKKDADNILAVYPVKKRKKQALRYSVGLKLHSITFFRI
jgi:ketopantoate reductase